MKNIYLYYDMTISRDGKIVKRWKKTECHSFVKQFVGLLMKKMCEQYVVLTDTSNVSRTIGHSDWYGNFYVTAPIYIDTYGSVVGTGTNAVSINDYNLQTKITHGTGSGQLQYSVETFGPPTTVSSGSSFVITRVFTNNSGLPITINEIGLVAQCYNGTQQFTYNFLIARDLLITSPPTLINSESLTLNYTITTVI